MCVTNWNPFFHFSLCIMLNPPLLLCYLYHSTLAYVILFVQLEWVSGTQEPPGFWAMTNAKNSVVVITFALHFYMIAKGHEFDPRLQ